LRGEFLELLPISIFMAFNLIGAYLVYYGIYGNNTKVEKLANDASSHWASLIVMALAYPVYLILSGIKKGGRNA
jgi:putative Mn2+ efflux pump MntP